MIKAQESYTTDYLGMLLERQDREFSDFKRLNPAEQARWQAEQYLRYSTEPWAFLQDCVYTLNQVSKDDFAIQPYPSYLEYLEFLTALWQREDKMAVPKSRRMVCSWSFIALYLHDTIFKEGRFNGLVSKKEQDAGDLVGRGEFIFKKIPEWRIPRGLLPKIKNGRMTKEPWVLEFEDINSLMRGFPQGADQLRQFTVSGLLGDECAFWEEAQAFYSASKPTLDGGGRMTLISSRSPGFFKKICYDQMDAPDLNFMEKAPVPTKRPMEGVEVWRNPKNGFVVVDLDYTADPRKRGEAWRAKTKAEMPARDFAMEYEKNWQTFDEKPVFSDFTKSLHVAPAATFHVEPHIPILLGFSFGLTPSCLIAQLVGRQLRIYKEFQVSGSVNELALLVSNHLSLDFEAWLHFEDKLFAWADPEGFTKQENDEKSSVDVLRKHVSRRIRSGEAVWETARLAAEDYMTRNYGDGPALLVSDNCPTLIDALSGGYRYRKTSNSEEPSNTTPVRDKFARIAECALLICAATSQTKKMHTINLETPKYGFLTESNTGGLEYGKRTR